MQKAENRKITKYRVIFIKISEILDMANFYLSYIHYF